MIDYPFLKMTFGVIATLGLFTILLKENKVYHFFEHLFIGLSVGWTLVAVWTEILKGMWWDKMVGQVSSVHGPGVPGIWMYVLLLPLGSMAYFVFSHRHGWISKIPIGIMLGFGAGQMITFWWNSFGPQVKDSMRVILPTQFFPFFAPGLFGRTALEVAIETNKLYPSQAINNFIFVFTLFAVMSYFLFSVSPKARVISSLPKMGRWLMMIGFGAIFGSSVMARFALVIDRIYFIWNEWLIEGILHLK